MTEINYLTCYVPRRVLHVSIFMPKSIVASLLPFSPAALVFKRCLFSFSAMKSAFAFWLTALPVQCRRLSTFVNAKRHFLPHLSLVFAYDCAPFFSPSLFVMVMDRPYG